MKRNQKSSILIFVALLLFNLNYYYQYNNIHENMRENEDIHVNKLTAFSFMQSNKIGSLEYYNSITSILSLNILYVSLIYSSILNYKDYMLNNSNKYRFLADLSLLLVFINETNTHNIENITKTYNGYAHSFWTLITVLNSVLEKKNYNIKHKIGDIILILLLILNSIFNKDLKKQVQILFFIEWLLFIHSLSTRYLNH